MRRALRDSRAEDEVVSVTVKLLDATGRTRQRTATFYTKKRNAEDSARLIRFHTPPEFAHSGILTIERSDGDADQWIYLPAYHASRRVPTANRGDTWMGTDFTYEDITDPKIERYEYRTLGTDRVNGIPCTLIEAVPRERKLIEESAYAKTVSCVDVEQALIVKTDYYDRSGQLFKVLTNTGPRRFGKYRRWEQAEMADQKRNHKTVLEFGERKLDRGLSDEYFDVHYLERGR
ncbi:MAG TPA: outer membrane lipoprotein-sorting protein [Candidatus Bathyarchaeia archaeon]|nr:outer membrane lipoprotein-sorting protein [Candidatus Bathyarchaeia archaeon]